MVSISTVAKYHEVMMPIRTMMRFHGHGVHKHCG